MFLNVHKKCSFISKTVDKVSILLENIQLVIHKDSTACLDQNDIDCFYQTERLVYNTRPCIAPPPPQIGRTRQFGLCIAPPGVIHGPFDF